MVMLNTSLEYLKSLIKKKISVSELEEILFDLGFEIDSLKGDEIVIEVTPDRPDLLSVHGLARAINIFLGEKPKEYKAKKSEVKVIVDKSVSMRPYTACAIIKNIKFDDEMIKQIMQIQEKLAATYGRNRKKSAYGLYPSKGINFPINYIAKDPGRIKFKPLGSNKEITAIKVEQIHPKGKEYNWIAKGWKKYPFFIDDKDNVMCMLPYTNSENTGKVDDTTTEIFIECTGVDLENVMKALNIFVTMFADMGGDIYSLEIIYPDKKLETPDLKSEEIKFNLENVNKVLGIKITKEEAINFLGRMGYLIKNDKVFVPCYRTDVLHEIDVIDDIGRAYGVKNFKPEFPRVSTIGGLMKNTRIKNRIRELMIGLGFQEVFTLILSNRQDQFCGWDSDKEVIFLENQVEKSINMLRVSIIPELLKVLRNNQHYEFPQKIFEVSEVVLPDKKSETRTKDKTYLSALISKPVASYEDISSVLDSLFSNLQVKYKLEVTVDRRFTKGRVASILINNKEIGVIGELCPKVLENFKLENPVVGFEIDLELFV